MKNLVSHIEYLLHTHNCVIIPGLGGFVLNPLAASRKGIAEFSPSGYDLVFNRDLTHNDGLLSESYMKTYGHSFEKATLQIEKAADELRRELSQKGRVEMGKLGAFVMHDERRFIYSPGTFVRPDVFGLPDVALKPIIQMQPPVQSRQTPGRRNIVRHIGIGTAAAAVIALALLVFPFNNSTSGLQNAHIFSENGNFSGIFRQSTSNTDVSTVTIPAQISELANPVSEVSAPVSGETEQPVAEAVPPVHTKKFYVVVGVYQVPRVAEKAIEMLKSEGFDQVGSMSRSGRTDVYIATFADKTEAETYLREVHKSYSNHRDAWVLKY